MGFPDRLYESGPKRLLALDGGGIRGVLSLGFLERIEAALRERHRSSSMVLADYFDLIGGTSTGAIIATLLSLGRSVAEIRDLYVRLGKTAFTPKKSWLGKLGPVIRARYDETPLAELLRSELKGLTLGSKEFRCGLMVVAKRADTASVWPMVNIPTQKYFEFNKELTLWEILRASTAAPTYFRSQRITDVGLGEEAVFVDGAISMHNSPALLLVMAATLKGFGLSWQTGERSMLLCSIGTGSFLSKDTVKRLSADNNLSVLPVVMTQLLSDAAELNETLLQWISRSPTARPIDSQIGDLQDDLLTPDPVLTYLRYDVALAEPELAALGIEVSPSELKGLRDIGNVGLLPKLQLIGERAANRIRSEHFPAEFDLSETVLEQRAS